MSEEEELKLRSAFYQAMDADRCAEGAWLTMGQEERRQRIREMADRRASASIEEIQGFFALRRLR